MDMKQCPKCGVIDVELYSLIEVFNAAEILVQRASGGPEKIPSVAAAGATLRDKVEDHRTLIRTIYQKGETDEIQ